MSASGGRGNEGGGRDVGTDLDADEWGVETQVTDLEGDGSDDEDELVTTAHCLTEAEVAAVQRVAEEELRVRPPAFVGLLAGKQQPVAPSLSLPRAVPQQEPTRGLALPRSPVQPSTTRDTSMKTSNAVTTQVGEPARPPMQSQPRSTPRSAMPGTSTGASMMPVAQEYGDDAPALVSHQAFKSETYRLARTRDYRSIAALHEAALSGTTWATSEEFYAALLVELARLYRDRLNDKVRAQGTFERLAQQRPGHAEAMEYLDEVYRAQSNMKALHDLYSMAVDEEWGPERRIELTRKAASIAVESLHDAALAARDWERLLELGDLDAQVTVELSRVYRDAGRWGDLGDFLQNRAAACADTTRLPILREAIEAYSSGANAPDRAEALIRQILTEHPDDTIALASLAKVRARQSRWAELEELVKQPMASAPAAARLDVLRLVAELLSAAGQHDRSANAYEYILQIAPTDKDAVAAREAHLRRVGDHRGLIDFLVARAEKTRREDERATRYQRAAEVAGRALDDPELAASLWQKSVAANPSNQVAYEALCAIHDRLGNTQGITEALEGLAKVSKDAKARAAVLRRLGDHYAYRADNDDQAQRCWREVLAIAPDDVGVQRELNGVHRRRGDFKALDAALTHQLHRTTEVEQAADLAREIAANLDENLQAPERTIRAWMRLLDLAPNDTTALEVLGAKLAARSTTTEVMGVLEVRLSGATAAGSLPEQIAIGLEIAEGFEARGEVQAAMAAYERVRTWAPAETRAIGALVRLHQEINPRGAMSALEIAAARSANTDEALGFLARAKELLPPDQPKARFFLARRLLRLGAVDGLAAVETAAKAASAYRDLAATYERLAEIAATPAQRRDLRVRLARLCEEQLGDAHRAYVALQSLTLTAATEPDRTELLRLAESTGRWEDMLAVMDASLESMQHEGRQQVLLRRAEVCERKLNDPCRAFLELHRLVQGRTEGELDDAENEALRQMHRLASEHGLLVELEAVYDELWDRAPNDDARVRVARARQTIRRDQLGDAAAGLEQALLVLRLQPGNADVVSEVLASAESLGQWDRVLPVVEGGWRATSQEPLQLTRLAALQRERRADAGHSTELLAEALRLEPRNEETQRALEAAAAASGRWGRAVLAIRLAAARTTETARGLELARKAASACHEHLRDEDGSLELHRWILQVWPGELASLDTVIEAHRARSEHAELRWRLEQWIERVSDTSLHVERWLEVGRICQDNLHDPAGALVAYSNVSELDPQNEEAAQAMRSLADVSLPTSLRGKQVKVELVRASGSRQLALLLQLAEVEQEMGHSEAAIATLGQLLAIDEGRELAHAPLARLLREAGSWERLASLEEEVADGTSNPEGKHAALRAALVVAEGKLGDSDRVERLLRKLLALTPEDHDAFFQLTRLLRNGERFTELAEAIAVRIEKHGVGHEPFEVRWMERELVRIRDRVLGATVDAEASLRASVDAKRDGQDGSEALWLASLALRKQDHAGYLGYRRQHLEHAPKRLAGYVLCHLAEHCDQYMGQKSLVLSLYREARALDPENALAADALRGLGRGVKAWRSTASLLQVPGEESLSHADRSLRLLRLGEVTAKADPEGALSWYERAVAVDPDNVAALDAIAASCETRGDFQGAFSAAFEAIHASERATPPSSEEAGRYARRCARTAELAQRAGRRDQAHWLSQVAYAVDPRVASAALLVADSLFERGATAEATAMHSRMLDQVGDALTIEQRARVLHRRAAAAMEASELDRAHDDLREALQLAPLFAPALEAMSEVQRRQGHPTIAALHALNAVLVTRETSERGMLCRRIGDLCDTALARSDEAGAWYELAAEAGEEDKTLARRLLTHYRHTGRSEQALSAIGELIEATSDPNELADLWAMRGSILADHDLTGAEQALDVALSFNPSHPTALAHLQQVLESRGDYEQLVALLDARTEVGTPGERAEALRTLARMCFENLDDMDRGEMHLQRLVEIEPSKEAYEQLLSIVDADPERHDERLGLLSHLLGFGPPFCDRIIDVARMVSDDGQRHWAWVLLSALMGAAPVDPWTKASLAELRKEFEKFDPLTLIDPLTVATLGSLHEPGRFETDLGDLCLRLFLDSDDGSGVVVDPRTGPGKIFERLAEQLGMPSKLLRGAEGTAALSVLAGDVPVVVVRSDLLTAPPAELAYLFAVGLMLARPECRVLACVTEADRQRIIPAIAAATDDSVNPDDEATARLASSIASVLTPQELRGWKQHLTDVTVAQAMAGKAFREIELAAMRVALVAAGDVRAAVRALARLSLDNKRPPGIARLDDFEAFFASIPMVAPLLAHAASAEFGQTLAQS